MIFKNNIIIIKLSTYPRPTMQGLYSAAGGCWAERRRSRRGAGRLGRAEPLSPFKKLSARRARNSPYSYPLPGGQFFKRVIGTVEIVWALSNAKHQTWAHRLVE